MEKRFTVKKKDFQQLLKKAFSYAEPTKKHGISVLRSVKISGTGNIFRVESTDNESAFYSEFKAGYVNSADNFCFLMSKNYLDFLKNYKSEFLEIGINDYNIPLILDSEGGYIIYSDKAVQDVGEYPELSKIDGIKGDDFAIVDNADFLSKLKKASIYADRGAIRPVFSSVRLFTEDGILKICATDSKRLYLANIQEAGSLQVDILIPHNFVIKFLKTCDPEKSIMFIIEKPEKNQMGKAFLANGAETYITKLIDGMYPDIKLVIPKEEGIEYFLSFDKTELTDVLKYFRIIHRTNGNEYHKTIITFNGDTAIFSYKEFLKSMKFDKINACNGLDDFKIGISSRYLFDYVGKSTAGEISVKITECERPVVVSDISDMALIMPIRLARND